MNGWRGNDLDLGLLGVSGDPLVMSRDNRSTHLYAVGSTGTGKSKFLEGLIRQDILAWPRSECGLMLLDPHGSLYDGLMTWIAANDLQHLPIVPIDLRRNDWTVAYNLLRTREGGDPSVIVANFVRGIAHAWGQGDLNETPRLAKWLYALLVTLYEKQWTLGEATRFNFPLLMVRCRHPPAAGYWSSTITTVHNVGLSSRPFKNMPTAIIYPSTSSRFRLSATSARRSLGLSSIRFDGSVRLRRTQSSRSSSR